MRKIIIVLSAMLFLASCLATKDTGISRAEAKQAKKMAQQELIKRAIESRRFIIKMNRLYAMNGGTFELVPRSNYILIDGGAANISLGYIGRQFGIRPISGINLIGKTTKYEMVSNDSKGLYNINIEVNQGGYKFDVYLSVGTGGYCNASINNSYLQAVSYRGYLVPIVEKQVDTRVSGARL